MVGRFPGTALEAAAVAAGLIAFGYLLADFLCGRPDLDRLFRWAMALPALVGWVLVLMVAHMLSGGRVFSHVWIVRIATGLAAATLIGAKLVPGIERRKPDRSSALAAVVLVLAAVAMWGSPVARLLPLGTPGSDTGWHMGWASQLMNGHSTPTALITGAVPNYYPWMFHAVVAFVAAFTPGGRAYDALGPLQLLQVGAAILALFALGRRIGRSWVAGAAVAVLGGLAAGFSVALLGGFDRTIHTPRSGGPRGTYNVSYNNLAPPLPRDLGYALFAAYLLILLEGLARRSRRMLVASGVLLGLIGLTSAEYFFAGLAIGALMAVMAKDQPRAATAAAVLGPALALYGLWLVPLMVSYVHLGGFVNTTAVRAIVLSPGAILMSWGVVTPLAAYGAWVLRREVRTDLGARLLGATVVLAGALLVVAAGIPRVLGQGFQIVGRSSRYWPILELGLALVGGIGAARLLERMARARRPFAVAWSVGAAGALLLLSVPLPVEVSVDYPATSPPAPVLAHALEGTPNLLPALEEAGGHSGCVVAARQFGFTIFSYTGYRLVGMGGTAHPGNAARIRWKDIYQRIGTQAQRLADQAALTSPSTDPVAWHALVAKYGVAFVIAPRTEAGAGVFAGYLDLNPDPSSPLALFRVGPCGGT